MDDERMGRLLGKVRTIAILGAKDTQGQAVDRVGRYLINAGYDIIPVHPARKNVWGLTTYPSLTEVPRPVDMIDVFRASEFCLGHARETLSMSPTPKIFWMQLGIRNNDAAKLLAEHGVVVIEDACLLVEHTRYAMTLR